MLRNQFIFQLFWQKTKQNNPPNPQTNKQKKKQQQKTKKPLHLSNPQCWSVLSHFLYSYCLCHYLDVRSLASSSIFIVPWSVFLRISFVNYKNASGNLTGFTAQVYILLMRFLLQSVFSVIFISSLRYFLIFFFHLSLFDGVLFPYFQVLVIFFFSKSFDAFLIW